MVPPAARGRGLDEIRSQLMCRAISYLGPALRVAEAIGIEEPRAAEVTDARLAGNAA